MHDALFMELTEAAKRLAKAEQEAAEAKNEIYSLLGGRGNYGTLRKIDWKLIRQIAHYGVARHIEDMITDELHEAKERMEHVYK